MVATGVRNPSKTRQAIGDHTTRGTEVGAGPVGDGLAGEAGDRGQFDVLRVALGRDRDRRDKWHLVFGAAAGGAAGQFAAQVGVVHLDGALQCVQGIALGHGLHEFLLEQPGGRVADAQLPFKAKAERPVLA